jgi:carbon monoxide dehydrogenase subunit G
MLLEHTFVVPVPPAEAWVVLLDLERVAPCMPGATLESVDGEAFTGKVKVKVGPITVAYQGKGRFTERDESAYRAVIEAAGRETRGSGTATATVTASLEPHGDGKTEVLVSTDLAITGRPAQFGRGVMSEVGAKLIASFAECLAVKITAGDHAGGDQATPAPAAAPLGGDQGTSAPTSLRTPADEPVEAEPIDLLDVAGGSVAKRVLPPVAGLAALAIVLSWWIRRRRR